jgi:hypothetical protein
MVKLGIKILSVELSFEKLKREDLLATEQGAMC